MAGLWHLSNQQLHDLNGKPYPGARASFFRADSLAPITVYKDYGLGTPHPNPVTADGWGIFPVVFLDEIDGFYRQRLTTTDGVTIGGTDIPVLPVIGPAEGGGGVEVPVDPNALFRTGDVMWLDVIGTRSGWVRDNGRTIGSATSGASERANADTEALFTFLWQTYSNAICPVTGSRGVSPAADFSANKPIGLPDKRGYIIGGVDDMGNSAAGRYASVPIISGTVIDAGAIIGETLHAISTAEMPLHTHTGTTASSGSHSHTIYGNNLATGPGGGMTPDSVTGSANKTTSTDGAHTHTFTTDATGSSNSHNNVQKTVLGSFYRKL